LLTFRGHTRGVVALAFSPTGDRVASASSDGTAKVWDPAGGQDLLTYRGNRGQLAGLAWRPDGRAVATLSVDVGRGPAEVKFWNPDTGVEAGSLPLPRQPDEAMLLAFSPDGQRLATASHGHTVLLWNARTRQELFTLRGHVRPIAAMAFSPDGARLVTASHDQTIKLWDTAGGEEILTLRGYGQETVLVAFSPDGQVLVTASKDGTLWRWERGTTWRERPRQAAAVGRQGRGSMPELLLPPPSRLFRATQVLPEPGD
jgi:WD40 repeat protein